MGFYSAVEKNELWEEREMNGIGKGSIGWGDPVSERLKSDILHMGPQFSCSYAYK